MCEGSSQKLKVEPIRLELPTVFKESAKRLNEVINDVKPDAVLSVGQAGEDLELQWNVLRLMSMMREFQTISVNNQLMKPFKLKVKLLIFHCAD